VKFSIIHSDPDSHARVGRIITGHGEIETPVFMPVGTQGSVKTLSPEELECAGTTIILNNAYHLYLRPGPDLLVSAGGSHEFCGWNKPILSDSGGYQVFSLADLNHISDTGVQFQSHLDGSVHFFTPEGIIDIQKKIGADLIMPLDRPVAYPSEKIEAQTANRITLNWLKTSKAAFNRIPPYYNYQQALFGIIQGSVFKDLRQYAVEETLKLDMPGYAIGGLSVGEPKELLYEITAITAALLPENRPRYLMGVGKPEDIAECIGLGVDMFDCVLPTRVGRNGWVYTPEGRLVLKNARYRSDFSPVDAACDCYACRHFSRAYLRHLFIAGEMLGPRLASLHNITYYHRIVREARTAISENRFSAWKASFCRAMNTFKK